MNANAAGVFVLTGEDALVPMQAASFASEDDFQKLLANFPALLAGEQIDSANPRRFMLVGREQPIASELGGSAYASEIRRLVNWREVRRTCG
jgi:hypothetical protein